MEAELKNAAPFAAPARHVARHPWREVVFSLDEAHRALPYVARVTHDAAQAFRAVKHAREALDATSNAALRRTLCDRRDLALKRLNAAIDDLDAVGVNLIDLTRGTLSLPGEIDGRAASLLWRLGDPVIDRWRGPQGE